MMVDAARKIAASAFSVLRRSHVRLEFEALMNIAYQELIEECTHWSHEPGPGWIAVVSKAVRNRTVRRYKSEELLLYKAWKPNPATGTRTWKRFLEHLPAGFDRAVSARREDDRYVRPLLVIDKEMTQLLARGLTPSQMARSLGIPIRVLTRALRSFRIDQSQLSWNANYRSSYVQT